MKKIKGIKAVSFDADQTLWDFQRVMRHSLGYVLKILENESPVIASKLSIDGMITTRNRVAEYLKGKTTNLEEIRLEAFRATLAETGHTDDTLAARLNRIYLQHRFDDVELYPDVLPTLTQLRENYRLGLLSNGNSYPARCGLDDMFGFVIFSQDIGYEKPSPRFYQIAIEKAGCRKEELLHIGDSLENDVIGAKNYGITSVWLNRDRVEPETDTDIDYEIGSLSELLKIL
jgi:putative hydrolase of the HAD superfamily